MIYGFKSCPIGWVLTNVCITPALGNSQRILDLALADLFRCGSLQVVVYFKGVLSERLYNYRTWKSKTSRWANQKQPDHLSWKSSRTRLEMGLENVILVLFQALVDFTFSLSWLAFLDTSYLNGKKFNIPLFVPCLYLTFSHLWGPPFSLFLSFKGCIHRKDIHLWIWDTDDSYPYAVR